jgi:hypothetical protein
MARHYVFLVHGMGKMDPAEWHKPFTTAIISALKQYEPFVDKPEKDIRAENLRFIPVTYDHILSSFHDRWEEMCDDEGLKASAFSSLPTLVGDVFGELSLDMDSMPGWKQFFWTHLLDPMLWYLVEDARMAVVAHVNKQLIKGLVDYYGEEHPGGVHILAHSQGTSVTHDALVALRHWPRDEGLFEPDKHVWDTVGMVANVGRLLETNFTLKQGVEASEFKVYRSALRPASEGTICKDYVNVHHVVDPFTWPRRFNPGDWPHSRYSDIESTRIRKTTQVHDFDHYFADPNVHVRLLRLLMMQRVGFCTDEERDRAFAKYRDEFPISTTTAFADLKDIFGDDPDRKLTPAQLALFLCKAIKELEL